MPPTIGAPSVRQGLILPRGHFVKRMTIVTHGMPRILRSGEKIQMPTLLTRILAIQTAPTREPLLLARLFLFVAIGCTNLADPLAASLTPTGFAAAGWEILSAVNDVHHLQGLSAAGPAGTAPEGGGTTPQQAVTPLASINKTMTNREVTVRAAIANVRAPRGERAPYIVTLTQDGATIPLVFWSDIAPPLTPKISEGNLIRAKVTVSEYRGHLQLRLRSAANLELVSTAAASSGETAKTAAEPAPVVPAATSAMPAARTKAAIGEIKKDWVDRIVTISGTISASDNIGSGQRLHVQDRTGEIQVVLWENVLGGLAATDLRPGRVITVTGSVKLYRGIAEIVPEAATDVKLGPQ